MTFTVLMTRLPFTSLETAKSETARTRTMELNVSLPDGSLCEESMHDPPVHVGEPVVAALELERQPRVVDAQAMQHRCVQVMNMHRVANNVVAEIVRLAVSQSGLNAGARQPDGETARMMVAAII